MTTEERLEALEREFARMKKETWQTNEIHSKKIVLEDQNGKTRASLGLREKRPYLTLFDDNGKSRMSFALKEMGPCLSLFDENIKQRCLMSVVDDNIFFGILDHDGNCIWSAP